jgi:isoleucyl-tRNA synthetase
MHKSWGNSIEFNEAAERMGVDVMRWMYAKQRPEENILFGYKTADEARKELLILWNVFAFFTRYARLHDWQPATNGAVRNSAVRDVPESILDRWILSRTAGAAADAGTELADYDSRGAAVRLSTHLDELSTWYLRRSRRRISRSSDEDDRDVAFSTLHTSLAGVARMLAPILPFLAEFFHQRLVVAVDGTAPDSVHLTRWPADDYAAYRDVELEAAMSTLLRAVELARTLRGQAGLRLRQPLRQMWLAIPGGRLAPGRPQDEAALLELLADETNVKQVVVIGDESELVERRVRALLPKIGPRLGGATQQVMAAARANEVEYLADGGVRLAGVDLAADEIEIIASPRPGTAVAHENGLVVVIDTDIDDELRAEGDVREISRAVQELRKQAALELDELIDLWIVGPADVLAALEPYMQRLTEDTLAAETLRTPPPPDLPTVDQDVSGGSVTIALRGRGAAS